MRRYLLPRLQDFLFIIVMAGAVSTGSRMLNTDSDLGRHLVLGNYMLRAGQIPAHDILSFTKAGESRPPYEWVAQILLALANRILDLDGVVLLTGVIIAAAFTLVYWDSVQRTGSPLIALLIALWAAIASSLHWLARPHIFSFLFFAIWVLYLERLRRGQAVKVWFFPLLMLIWANTHGGFVFGFLAYAAYAAGWILDRARGGASPELGRRLLMVGFTSAITSVMTPALWQNWVAVLNNRSSFILSRTVETMPPQLAMPGVWPFIGLLAILALLFLLERSAVSAVQFILLAGLAGMSFTAARNIPFFAIAAAPIATDLASRALKRLEIWSRIEAAISEIEAGLGGHAWAILSVLVLLGGFVYWHLSTRSAVFGFRPEVFPVQAADWIEAHTPTGHMFNDFNWGGYLLYRLWPAQRVFIDSQSDFYGEPFVRQYAAIMDGSADWRGLFNQYGVGWVVIPPSAPLAHALQQDAAWQQAYQDGTASIYIHR